MLGWMREKIGPVIIGIIIGFIAIVFVFYGVFSPKSTRGYHQGAVAGIVNGETISLSEFNKALNQKLEFFKQMTGGKITEDQIKNFKLKEAVFNELVNRKLLGQAAKHMGLMVGDEEVRSKIRGMQVFYKEGKFDASQYRGVLVANNYTPSGFERLMREDLILEQIGSYFRSRSKVSDEEVQREFLMSHEKRNIKYVLLTSETGKKANLAEASKKGIATEPPKKTDLAEVQKINEALAIQVLALMGRDKNADKKVDAILKPVGVTVKATGLISRSQRYVPGLGEVVELIKDAFDKKHPIDISMGGKAKRYSIPSGIVVALVVESETPDLSRLSAERDQIIQKISFRKEQNLIETFLKQSRIQAKIEKNKSVVDGVEEFVADIPYDGG